MALEVSFRSTSRRVSKQQLLKAQDCILTKILQASEDAMKNGGVEKLVLPSDPDPDGSSLCSWQGSEDLFKVRSNDF